MTPAVRHASQCHAGGATESLRGQLQAHACAEGFDAQAGQRLVADERQQRRSDLLRLKARCQAAQPTRGQQ